MEYVSIKLDDDSYNQLVHGADYPQAGDLVFARKREATGLGKPCIAIGFTIMVDGKPKKVQAVTTQAAFLMAAKTIEAAP